MDKQAIKTGLTENHNQFIAYVSSLTSDAFLSGKNGKWSPGQQLEHILLGVRPVRYALGLPKLLLKMIFGQANRKGRSYEELVNKYLQKLENGGRASARFIPGNVAMEKKNKLITALQGEVGKLEEKMDKFTEEELGKFVLPHPLLGKLTIREMLMFTVYHVEHHKKLTERDLQ